jgi:pilus assembly protein Flp/PilA
MAMGEPRKNMPQDDRGATSIEYALIATLVAIVIIGSLTTLGTSLSTRFVSVNSGFTSR